MKLCQMTLAASLTLLCACNSASHTIDDNHWNVEKQMQQPNVKREFLDLNLEPKTLSFQKVDDVFNPNKVSSPVVKVFVNGKLLGEAYNLYTTADLPLPVIYRLNGKSLNPNNPDDVKKLSKAKKWDFYEFGRGRISHMQITAKNGICRDFRSNAGVSFKIATTYPIRADDNQGYPTNEYLAYLIEGNYQNGTEFNINAYSAMLPQKASKAFKEKFEASVKQKGDQLANANAAEKGRMLESVICP